MAAYRHEGPNIEASEVSRGFETRRRELQRRGLTHDHAVICAGNGRGPWWNAGASHMNRAVPKTYQHKLGLVSLLDEIRRLVNLG